MKHATAGQRDRDRPEVASFEGAQDIAIRNGLPGFCAWRAGLERRYTVMPPWYWNEQACRRRYVAQIRACVGWQERERRINRGYVDFQQSLAGRLTLE